VESRLDLARELGATHVINTSNLPSLTVDLIKAMNDIVPGGTNVNLDTTGFMPIIDAGVQALHPKGEMVLIGVVDGKMSVDLGAMLRVRLLSRRVSERYADMADWNGYSRMYRGKRKAG
jgi:Zn-dependent alcohol dehydrogenase